MNADIIIVGGGIAGCLLANELSNAGMSIILIESGNDLPVGDWRKGHWMDPSYDQFVTVSDLPYNANWSRVKALGGSTEAWEGYCYRLCEEEFRMKSQYGKGSDWPISLSELEPYYRKAEKFLGVAGDHSEFGRCKSDRAPIPSFGFEDYEKHIINSVKNIGIKFIHVPQARNSIGYSRRPACQNIGTCNYCKIYARWSPSARLIPGLRKSPNVKILTETICKELIRNQGRKASGIMVYSKQGGRSYPIFGNTIILAAGTIDTIRILLLSKSLWRKKDLKIFDQLGRNFMDHPILRAQVRTTWRTSSKKRQTNILASSHDFRKFDIKTKSPGFVLNLNSRTPVPNALIAAHMEMMPSPSNRISLSNQTDYAGLPLPKLTVYSNKGLQRSTVLRAGKILHKISSIIGCGEVQKMPIQLWACHLMGGTPMGTSAEDSVLDRNLKLHSHDNVFVASLACMPTSSSVNPTLTLAALTLRLGNYIQGKF